MGANGRNVEVTGSSAKQKISIYIGRTFSRMFLDLLFLWIAYDKILSNFCFSFLLYRKLKIRIDLDLSRSWELPINILVSLSQ